MMRQKLHSTLKSAAVGLPLSLFSIIYVKAIIHAVHENIEHQEKMKKLYNETGFQPHETTMWSRFKNTYLPLFPILPQSKPTEFDQKSSSRPK